MIVESAAVFRSIQAELISFGIGQDDMILMSISDGRAESGQALDLRLRVGSEQIQLHTVLRAFGFRHELEPQTRPSARRLDEHRRVVFDTGDLSARRRASSASS